MQLEIDLMRYDDLNKWKPQIGDSVFRDGVFSRWCGVIDGIDKDNLSIRMAGNPRLLVMGDYKSKIIKMSKVVHSMRGSHFVITKDGIYYV